MKFKENGDSVGTTSREMLLVNPFTAKRMKKSGIIDNSSLVNTSNIENEFRLGLVDERNTKRSNRGRSMNQPTVRMMTSCSPKSKKPAVRPKSIKRDSALKKKVSVGSSRLQNERNSAIDHQTFRPMLSYSKEIVRARQKLYFEPSILKDKGKELLELGIRSVLQSTAGKPKGKSRELKKSHNNSRKTMQTKKGISNSGVFLETSMNECSTNDDLKENILFALNRLHAKMTQEPTWKGDYTEYQALLHKNTNLKLKMKRHSTIALSRLFIKTFARNLRIGFELIKNP